MLARDDIFRLGGKFAARRLLSVPGTKNPLALWGRCHRLLVTMVSICGPGVSVIHVGRYPSLLLLS